LEQASKDMDEEIQRLVLMREAATVSISSSYRTLIAEAKQEHKIIVQNAKSEAESMAAQSKEIIQDAKNEAESILAGALEETKKWEAEKTALAGMQHFERSINLNVGGVRYTTSLTTLRRFPDTMLGCMFSGRHTLLEGEDGHFFIDRDGMHFRHILNFLRSPEGYKVALGVRGAVKEELRCECEYYGIDHLMFNPQEVDALEEDPEEVNAFEGGMDMFGGERTGDY
jgi:hypothetical protein